MTDNLHLFSLSPSHGSKSFFDSHLTFYIYRFHFFYLNHYYSLKRLKSIEFDMSLKILVSLKKLRQFYEIFFKLTTKNYLRNNRCTKFEVCTVKMKLERH